MTPPPGTLTFSSLPSGLSILNVNLWKGAVELGSRSAGQFPHAFPQGPADSTLWVCGRSVRGALFAATGWPPRARAAAPRPKISGLQQVGLISMR